MDTLTFKKLLRNVKIKKYMALIFACGILLMAFSNKIQKPPESGGFSAKDSDNNVSSVSGGYDDETETRLERLFEKIDGAGNVKVMITYKSGPEKVVATETKSSEDSTEESNQGVSRYSKSVSSEVKMAYAGNSISSGGDPFIVKENMPEIEGIVVVAQGGGDIMVKEAISKAAQALFDVPSYKIEVLKMGE